MLRRPLLGVLMILALLPGAGISQHESAIDSSFADQGFLELEGTHFEIRENQIRHVHFEGANLFFQRFDLEGRPDTQWAPNGIIHFEISDTLTIKYVESRSDNGYIVLGVTDSWILFSMMMTDETTLDSTYGNNGILIFSGTSYSKERHWTMENGKTLLASESDSLNPSILTRLTDKGEVDLSFGQEGIIKYEDNSGDIVRVEKLSDQYLAVVERSPILMNATKTTVHFFDQEGKRGAVSRFPFDLTAFSDDRQQGAVIGFGQYPGEEETAKLIRYSHVSGPSQFDESSEAFRFHTIPANAYTLISDIDVLNDGQMVVGGDSGFGQKLFCKLMDGAGRKVSSFGVDGSLFFKKPGATDSYYYANEVVLHKDAVYMSFRHDEISSMTVKHYIVKLDPDFISSAYDRSQTRHIEFFPNPGNGRFTFSIPESIETIQVYDLHGRLVKTTTEQKMISLGDVSSGIYQVRIITQSGFIYQGQIVVED